MNPISYAAPTALADALALLAESGGQARMLAGGTDIIPQLDAYQRDAALLIDAKSIPELAELSFDPESGLTLGAAVPCCRIYEDANVRCHFAGLVDAVSIIGGTAIQSRASVGGNLCNSGPAADSIPPIIVYSATARIASPRGERRLPVEEFCTAPGRNALAADELLISLQLPTPPARAGARYLRFIPRNEMDIAEVGAAAFLALDEEGRVAAARIALGAVAPTPLLVPEAGAALIGRVPDEATIEEAARLAQAAARPITDMRGTAEHRKHLAAVLTRRALQGALQRALSQAARQ